jgi:hypothetical protein
VGASTITLVGLGCGDDRRAYAVRDRFEGKHAGKSAAFLDHAGAAGAWVRRLASGLRVGS